MTAPLAALADGSFVPFASYRRWYHRRLQDLAAAIGGPAIVLLTFLTLPVLNSLTATPQADLELRSVGTTELPPPPPDQPEPEPAEPAPRDLPQFDAPAQQPDLEQIALSLEPGLGAGGSGVLSESNWRPSPLRHGGSDSEGVDDLFAAGAFDRAPRTLFQAAPRLAPDAKKATPGQVTVIFFVDEHGRVAQPSVQSSTDPRLERPSLDAVRRWRFEPGTRNGQPVRFRMRQTFTFPGR